jgi:hypothetical protein
MSAGNFVEQFQYRKDTFRLTDAERKNFKDALIALNHKFYPDGVSYWFKQDQIHQSTHVHGGPAFIPWHRELMNRFERDLQLVDPLVYLPYWDWNFNPKWSMITDFDDGSSVQIPGFMGSGTGNMGPIWENNSFYKADCDANPPCREDDDMSTPVFPFVNDPTLPPGPIFRNNVDDPRTAGGFLFDNEIVADGAGTNAGQQWVDFRNRLEGVHNAAHGWIGGTLLAAHSAFQDPIVFLLHTNVDRLWASWQKLGEGKPKPSDCTVGATDPRYANNWRVDPKCAYETEMNTTVFPGDDEAKGIAVNLEPWAATSADASDRIRPWSMNGEGSSNPDDKPQVKTSAHISVTEIPLYDVYATP